MTKLTIKITLLFTVIAFWLVTLYYAFGVGGLAGQYYPDDIKLVTKRALKLINIVQIDSKPCDLENKNECGYNKVDNRHEISCDSFTTADNTAVFFIAGQSNSANYGRGQLLSSRRSIARA